MTDIILDVIDYIKEDAFNVESLKGFLIESAIALTAVGVFAIWFVNAMHA